MRVDFDRIRSVLIVRDDRIGDVVLTLPMASAIKAARPSVAVDVLLRRRTAPLARRHPHVDRVIELPDEGDGGAGMVTTLREARHDLVLVPHSTGAMAALAWRAGIRYRVGNGFRWHSWRYNVPVFQRRRVPAKHELDYNLDLLRPWMRVPERNAVRFHAVFGDDASSRVRAFLASHGVVRYMVVHPGSGGSAVDLPAANFAAWLRVYRYGGHVIVTGTRDEAALVDTVVAGSPERAVGAAGRFGLEEMMALIAGAEFFLSNSTGPLHVARALERPLLGIYTSVAACHPKRWGPYAWEESHTLLPPGEEFARFEADKKRSEERMRALAPEMISAAIERVIAQHAAPPAGRRGTTDAP